MTKRMPAYPPPLPADAATINPKAASSASGRPVRVPRSQTKKFRRVTRPELQSHGITRVDLQAMPSAEAPSAPAPPPAHDARRVVYGGAAAEEQDAPRESARDTAKTEA